MYTGYEHLISDGEPLPEYTMLRFWQVTLSDILFNMTRGSFAEFIVRCALDAGGFKCLDKSRSGIDAYDIDGPDIDVFGLRRPSRIEVKSAASVQYDTPPEKEPISLPPGRIVFGIPKRIDFSSGRNTEQHNNDLYVFCHYTATRKSDNMLDMQHWDFYVYPTFKIDNDIDTKLSSQKTISLARLNQIGVPKRSFTELYDAISQCLSEITAYYSSNL